MPCWFGGGSNKSMPNGVATSTHHDTWIPRKKDIKNYLHFDRRIKKSEISVIANDPGIVARNSFYPMLRFTEEWTRFRKGGIRKKKVRPLRYSSRRDAAIYARYRALLSPLYEDELIRRGLREVPIAYRRIPDVKGQRNKCNIEFARDIFSEIKKIGDCIVTVVDIKSYFDSIDHCRIKEEWEKLIGGELPPDHEAVFRAVTKYTFVDIDLLFERLEMYQKGVGASRVERRSRKIDLVRRRHDVQLCSPKEFRDMVCGGDKKYPSLIQKNSKNYGIPQGTPISDIIANFYLIGFDEIVNKFCSERGGLYRRYSDDIICVVPTKSITDELQVKEFLQKKIPEFGSALEIQDKKVSVSAFVKDATGHKFNHVFGSRRNGLEYLGFEYDGKIVKIKNSTLSNAWRKLKRYAFGHAKRYVKQYRNRGKTWLQNNYPSDWLQRKLLWMSLLRKTMVTRIGRL